MALEKITRPDNILDYSLIENFIKDIVALDGNCTHPAGHCYGSDGGSGIPENLKVAKGRGGSFEAWKLNAAKTKIETKYNLLRCQYCQKYVISEKIEETKTDTAS